MSPSTVSNLPQGGSSHWWMAVPHVETDKDKATWKLKGLKLFLNEEPFSLYKGLVFSCLKYTQQLWKLYFGKKPARPLQQPGVNNFPSWVNNFHCWVNSFHSWVNNFRCSVNSFHSWVNNFHFWVNYFYSWVNNFHLSTKHLISRKQTNISQ